MTNLALKCWCGAVNWSLEKGQPAQGVRYICHCDDCQAFAHYTGHPERVLDVHGGTDAYQLPSSQVKISKGAEQLACVHMTARRLLRWHCNICKAPVANTYNNSKLSFVSIPLCGSPVGERSRVLGPVSGHVWTKFGKGDLSEFNHYSIPKILWRMLARMIQARVGGDYRDNTFFDKHSGKPIAEPVSLNADERRDLDMKLKTSR